VQDLLDADLVDKILEVGKLDYAPEKHKDHQKGQDALVHDPPGIGGIAPQEDPAQVDKKSEDEDSIRQPVVVGYLKVVDRIQESAGHQSRQKPPGGLRKKSGAKGDRTGIRHVGFYNLSL